MGWSTSIITAEDMEYAVADEIIDRQLYSVDVRYVSDCTRSTVYVAYCKNGEVRGLVVLVSAKKLACMGMDKIEVSTKIISLEMGPVECECPLEFFDMLTPPTAKEQYFLNWYLKAGKCHGI